MNKQKNKVEFFSLLGFLVIFVLALTNGFGQRIFAQSAEEDTYLKLDPIGDVLAKIQEEYVSDADMDKLVEGALIGMMLSLDQHSSFITESDLKQMQQDTKGEFYGIGVQIKPDEQNNIMVFAPIEGSPAAEAGLLPGDLIIAIDGVSTQGMTTSDAADKIRGPLGTPVTLSILRKQDVGDPETLDITIKRDKVPLESIKEARILEGGIGYMRIGDFKETTARDMRERFKEFLDQGMQSFILDLRWNPGGLLNASKEVCELFLPKGSLVTYTKGRERDNGRKNPEDMTLVTEERPVLPADMPIMILVNGSTASSSEIVTGALQYYERALILGEKTFGKGSVQTIIPLMTPQSTALRLTTALYYTPADVTINHQGIIPDIEVPMSIEQQRDLFIQLATSASEAPDSVNKQNHGSVTNGLSPEAVTKSDEEKAREEELLRSVEEEFGPEAADKLKEATAATETTVMVEDTQLQRAVEILKEDTVWEHLIKKYHRDVHETQMAADQTSQLTDDERRMMIQATVGSQAEQEEEEKAPAEQSETDPAL